MSRPSVHFTLSPRVLAGVKSREDAIVARIETLRTHPTYPNFAAVKTEYRMLHQYLFRHVFSIKQESKSPAADDSVFFIHILRHEWANLVNMPFCSLFSEYSRYRTSNLDLAIATIRHTSLLLETALQFVAGKDPQTSLSVPDLLDRAIKIANPANTHRIVVIGKGAMNSYNKSLVNLANRFGDFANMLELLTNAIKYSPVGSTITIRFSHIETKEYYGTHKTRIPGKKRPKITRHKRDEPIPITYFFLTVTDQGIGIPPDEIKHIATDIMTAKQGYRASNASDFPGTGFGLFAIANGRKANEKPTRILSPAPRHQNPDSLLPGTEVRISLSTW